MSRDHAPPLSIDMSGAPRVVYSLPDGVQSSVLLRTRLLEELLAPGDYRWCFVSPLAAHASFAESFRRPGVELIAWPDPALSRFDRALQALWQEHAKEQAMIATSRIFARRSRFVSPWRHLTLRPLARALRWLPSSERWLEVCEGRLASDGRWGQILDEHDPVAVVLGSAAIKPAEAPLARAARRRGLPVFGVVPSWDNLTSKGARVRLCDELAVWCDRMRGEAQQLCGFDPQRITITGPPAFDSHFAPIAAADRQRFLSEAGLDPQRRLITYTSVTPAVCPFSVGYAELLANWIAAESLGPPCQLLVRLHPQDDFDAFSRLAQTPHVRVQRAGEYRGNATGHAAIYQFDPSDSDQRRLTLTLAASDVVVNIASTITLEACALDRPTVNIAFNLPGHQERFVNLADYYRLNHYQPVARSGAVAIARSEAELRQAIRAALADPQAQGMARRRLYQQFDPFSDGRAAPRLASAVLDFARRAAARAPRAARRLAA